MSIEGFEAITGSVALAKRLYDLGRSDIVEQHFSDTLSWDSAFESIYAVITSIFSDFYSDYDDGCEDECLIFSDDCISRYYEIAWEYGRSHNVCHDENPFVQEAEYEANRLLRFCYSTGYKLLAYTKTRKTARNSKLIVYMGTCDCDCHGNLAYALVRLYEFFTDKCAEIEKRRAAVVPFMPGKSEAKKHTVWKDVKAA